MKKKQLLDELTRRGLTDDVKVVSLILKVYPCTHADHATYSAGVCVHRHYCLFYS